MSFIELLIGFVITWSLLLVPAAITRAVKRRPLEKGMAVLTTAVFFISTLGLTRALGIQEYIYTDLILGLFACYYVLRWQTKSSAAKATADVRKSLGYGIDSVD